MYRENMKTYEEMDKKKGKLKKDEEKVCYLFERAMKILQKHKEKIEFIDIENIIDGILLEYFGAICTETGYGYLGKTNFYFNEKTQMIYEVIFDYDPFSVNEINIWKYEPDYDDEEMEEDE